MSPRHHEIDTAAGRRRAKRYHFWVDHEFLRYPWTNFAEVAPGVFRSNHPTRARLAAYAAQGIHVVISLRGGRTKPHHLLEVEACDELGLSFHSVAMSARHAPTLAQLHAIFELLDQVEPPFVMHCKSGADRTGLVSALYLLHYRDAPLEVAAQQLSLRFLHVRAGETGILDLFLETYAERHRATGIGVRDWIASEYDPDALTEAYAQRRRAGWFGWLRPAKRGSTITK